MSNAEITHREFKRAHADDLSALRVRRDAEFQRAAEIRAAADAGHNTAAADVASRHAAECERRLVSFQRWAAAELDEAVATYEANPTRPNALAIADVFEKVDKSAASQLDSGEAKKVVSDALLFAFMAQYAKNNPEGLARLTTPQNWAETNWGSPSIGGATSRAIEALRRKSVVESLARLEELEEQIGRVGAANSGCPRHDGDPADRFQAMRFGGSPGAIEAEISRLEKKAHEKRHGTTEQIIVRANAYEAAIASRNNPVRFVTAAADAVTNLLFGQPAPEAPPSAAQAKAQADFDDAVARMPNSAPAQFV